MIQKVKIKVRKLDGVVLKIDKLPDQYLWAISTHFTTLIQVYSTKEPTELADYIQSKYDEH